MELDSAVVAPFPTFEAAAEAGDTVALIGFTIAGLKGFIATPAAPGKYSISSTVLVTSVPAAAAACMAVASM